jgi:DNA-binding response OmpR family regulator
MRIERHLKASTPAEPPAKDKVKILLVGRNETNCVEVQAALARLQNVSVETLNATTRLSSVLEKSASPPHVFLVDVDSGSSEDFELIRSVKSAAAVQFIPVVAVTDRTTDLAPLRAIRAGADDVLLKPIDLEEVKEVFSRVAALPKHSRQETATLGKVFVFMHLSGGAGATTLAVNAGLDLFMEPQRYRDFIRTLRQLVDEGKGGERILVEDPIANELDPKVKPNPEPRPQREEWVLAKQVAAGLLIAAVTALIKLLAKVKGEVRADIVKYLTNLSGQQLGLEAGAWQVWWHQNEMKFEFPPEQKQVLARNAVGTPRPQPAGPSYYGLPLSGALTLSYFLNKNLAVELFCCFAKHEIDGRGTIANLGEIARRAALEEMLANVTPPLFAPHNYINFRNPDTSCVVSNTSVF